MGKLHRIRRFLAKPENRERVERSWFRGLRVRRRVQPYVWYGNSHRKYIDKFLRG